MGLGLIRAACRADGLYFLRAKSWRDGAWMSEGGGRKKDKKIEPCVRMRIVLLPPAVPMPRRPASSDLAEVSNEDLLHA